MKLSRVTSLALAALALAGCGESHSAPEDAQIVFDAFFPDAGTDSGPPPSTVGNRCASDEECGPGTFCEGQFGGYCTAICASDDECPTGSVCIQVSMTTSYCLAECGSDPSGDQCPAGNGCTGGQPGLPPVCLPGCEDDTDCGTGQTCVVGGGGIGSGICIDPDAPLGGACTADEQCPPSATCASEAEFDQPGGACIIFGCDPGANTGCPDDAQCLPAQFGGGICWDGCETDADCRAEYACVPDADFPDRRTCQARFVDDNLGGACFPEGSCAGGQCLSENQTGFPQSYCALTGCDPVAGTGCPDAGVCVPTADGGGLCLLACDAPTDCRSGYRCRVIDFADPSSATACFPGCTEDAQCTGIRRDGTRNVCNPGTGSCGRPFSADALGDPCAGGFTECAGGRCLTEDLGWPGGMCTYPGCRLSGEGPASACPTGSVCTDDGAGDPTIGVCVPGCEVGGASTCRSGYACVPVSEGSTEGACRPPV
jgi:hypothetical protein